MLNTANNLTHCTLLIFYWYIIMHHIPNIWTDGMFYEEFYIFKSEKYLATHRNISEIIKNGFT